MVLQMPVFVALFNILYMTIDLRQAPFMFLWIKDLSVQDRSMYCRSSWVRPWSSSKDHATTMDPT